MELTVESITKDIEGFKERIRKAQQALDALPPFNQVSLPERRAYMLKRNKLQAEVLHVGRLIQIATEALDE